MNAPRRLLIALATASVVAGLLGAPWSATAAPVQAGFDLTVGDVKFILQQIQIAEAHRARDSSNCTVALGLTVSNCAVGSTNVYVPGSTSATDISDPRLMLGLRQVDGRNNNLSTGFSQWNGVANTSKAGNSAWGSADQAFPRFTPERWRGTDVTTPTYGPVASGYSPTLRPSNVIDPQPRVISNLVIDQSAANPAAVQASGVDVSGLDDAQKADVQLPILNTAANAGVGPPVSGMFSLFGQFFDHGLDLIGKTGSEVVFIPLQEDDPLYVPGSPVNFMALNRTVLNGNNAGTNTTTPWIDQNQTYTSHSSHQVFLRAYGCATVANSAPGTQCSSASRPVATGLLLDGAAAKSIATWDEVKTQARAKLGIALSDYDVTNVPLMATDEYGRFLRGPNGFPLLVLANGRLVEGNPANPPSTVDMTRVGGPVDAVQRTGHAFLDDIARGAAPKWTWNGTMWVAAHDAATLGKHFITGDGRGNENIGLTSIHAVFHSEHNRLVDQIKTLIATNETGTSTGALFAYGDWRTSNSPTGDWNGERLMQAARFINEMEYQHLVFGEFVRRVQPLVRAFVAYDPTLDPSITAEFAIAVYRYGHSQLNEDIARTAADGTDNSLPLFDAFLSPSKFTLAKGGGQLTTEQAVGQVARGMSAQRANEIDEFITGAMRNRLLGAPLDLGSLNIARGRDTGMQSLNGVRRALYGQTGDLSLQPYASWTDLGLGLRHSGTLVNLIAAYGTHPSVTTQTTVVARRAAAQLIVTGGPGAPVDRAAFLASAGDWASEAVTGTSTTGVDDVDLWVGGIAERRPEFGGLLGSTFDYIFKAQMENLQEGDRLYYLGRLAGLNLSNQIETNLLSEIIMRNSDADALPALIFDYPTLRFDMSKAANAYPQIQVQPDDAWRYGGSEHTVFNGTSTGNGQWAGSGDDTLRGNDGPDDLQGDFGDDQIIGGSGDDVLVDSAGLDSLTGGPGNDFIASGGTGLDAFTGGAGSDFMVAGGFGTAQLGGQGNDFSLGGSGPDTASGDSGDDWIEGGSGSDAATGDAVAPFGLDVEPPGNDVLRGNGGNNLDDGAGGFDISVGGEPGTNGVLGGLGFDWRTYYNAGAMNAANADLTNVAPAPGNVQAGFADTFLDVEALSGGDLDDTLSGDIRTTLAVPGTPDGDILTPASLPVIDGLRTLLGVSSNNTAITTWATGDILIGGAGSDRLQGRQGGELLDGDAYLSVQISTPPAASITGPTTPDPARVGRVLIDSLSQVRVAVERREVNPSQLIIVRTVRWAPHGTETDTAVYNGVRGNYSISSGPGGLVRVTDNSNGGGNEGVDTLRGIERLAFTDQTVNVSAPNPPRTVAATWNNGAAVTWASASTQNGALYPVTGYVARAWDAAVGGTIARSCSTGSGTRNCTITGLTTGRTYYVDAASTSAVGSSTGSPEPRIAIFVPGTPVAPTDVAATPGLGSAGASWQSLAGAGAGVTYTARAWSAPTLGTIAAQCGGLDVTSCTIATLANGTTYYVDVTASNLSGTSTSSLRVPVTPSPVRPGAPTLTRVARGGSTLTPTWAAPVSDGGSAITGYTARAWSGPLAGALVATCTTSGALTCALDGLTNGATYYLDVVASNLRGSSEPSTRISGVPATSPGSPALPALVVALNRTTEVGWAAPSSNGSPITGYTASAWSASSGGTELARCTTVGTTTCTLGALSDGTEIWVSVTATNALGTGTASPRAAGVIAAPPVAPTAPRVTNPSLGDVLAMWVAPSSNGSPITRYTATAWSASSNGTVVAQCATDGALECTITGVTAGTTTWVSVSATNAIGTSSQSPRTQLALPTAPARSSAPTALFPAAGQVTARWSPTGDGGSPVTGYTVIAWTASSGGSRLGQCATDGALECTITDLATGARAWVAVHATSRLADGQDSPRTEVLLPVVPTAPLLLRAAPATLNTARIAWGAPTNDGGKSVTGYRARVFTVASGGTPITQCEVAATLCTVTGLPHGKAYWIAVDAITVIGHSPESARVRVFLPSLPALPTLAQAGPGPSVGSVRVRWAAPLATGGAPIARYSAFLFTTASRGTPVGRCVTTRYTCVVTGLASGGRYYAALRAENVAGPGLLTRRTVVVAR